MVAVGATEEDGMRIEVDPDRCEGQAVCVGLAPKFFELNDDDEDCRRGPRGPAEARTQGCGEVPDGRAEGRGV